MCIYIYIYIFRERELKALFDTFHVVHCKGFGVIFGILHRDKTSRWVW